MKTLDFRTVKKNFFRVTLADKNNTTLDLRTPSKKIIDDLFSLYEGIDPNDEEPTVDRGTYDQMYKIAAEILSCNSKGRHIDKKWLETLFDMDDLIALFTEYMDFIRSIQNQKN